MMCRQLFVLLAFLLALCSADTPANCLYEDIKGTWTVKETSRQNTAIVGQSDCDILTIEGSEVAMEKNFTLSYPNIVVDEMGNQGTWTMIYNQGFEININERSYYSFSYYEGTYASATSYCNQTSNGWARDKTVRHWSCISATKTTPVAPRQSDMTLPSNPNQFYKNDLEMVYKINTLQNSWTAKAYPEWEEYTVQEMFARGGGPTSKNMKLPATVPPSAEIISRITQLPDSFDWRNVSGENYISPIRDQMSCGSCYAFASMANLEANLRIVTRNQRQDIFSPQDANDCSYLAQGCNGGFDYLIAGRYAMDQGVVAESCNPYIGADSICTTDTSCDRTYVSAYEHVGGYYGACNEQEMLDVLVTKGPISVSFEVYDDFYAYTSGIYHHVEAVTNEFNPFEITNHVVLIVGYGSENGEKYWIVKNSWGEDWGEDGFFRIRRGTDESSIESMAVFVTVIP